MTISKLIKALFFVTACTARVLHQEHSHQCVHDTIDHNPHYVNLHHDIEDLELAVAPKVYPNMKFNVDYTTFKTDSEPHKKYVTKELLPPIMDYFSKTLKIKKRAAVNLVLPNQANLRQACGLTIPNTYFTTGVSADTTILVSSIVDENVNFLAVAMPCFVDVTTNRPYISKVQFNFHYIKPAFDIISHEKNIYVTMHEMIHALGFSQSQYAGFIDLNGKKLTGHVKTQKVNGKDVTVLNVEPLTSKLRKHFGCDKIPGAILENEGTAGSIGSHLERKIFQTEIMTSSVIHDMKISELSLALLEGTGWYAVDYSMAEPYFTGAGAGCLYYLGMCEDDKGNAAYPEFCSAKQKFKIAESGNGRAYCSADKFADGCNIPFASPSFDCRLPAAVNEVKAIPQLQSFGIEKNPKMFLATLNTGSMAADRGFYCFSYECEGSDSNTSLTVTVGNEEVECKTKGPMSVNGLAGELECPDPIAFCATKGKSYCPRGCMGRGTCKDNKCVCDKGFKGRDCTEAI